MSGLLQRLGARATGTAWAVRSDVRLPFSAERMAPDLRASAAVDPVPTAAPQRPGMQAQALAESTGVTPAPLVAYSAPAQQHAAATDAQRPRRPQDTRAAAQATRAQAQPPAALQTATAAQPLEMLQALGKRPPARAQGAVESIAVLRARTADSAPPEAPEPLLPAAAGSRTQPSNALRPALPAAIGQQCTQAAAQQDTEVHIHIGRIDVTAVHETSKPKARPRERAQPMSLDAYLAKRGTGS